MKLVWSGLAVLTVMLASSGTALANACLDSCVTYSTTTVTTEAANYGSAFFTPLSQSEYITIPEFNPALGTLVSVRISFSAATGAEADPTDSEFQMGTLSTLFVQNNQPPSDPTWTESLGLQAYLMDPTNPSCYSGVGTTDAIGFEATSPCLLEALTSATPGANLSYSAGPGVDPGASGTITTPISLSASAFSTLSSNLIGDFEGTGNLSLPVYVETEDNSFNSAGNGNTGSSLFVGSSAFITYDYTPSTPSAPEPASALLFGGALVSLGLMRFRKRSI